MVVLLTIRYGVKAYFWFRCLFTGGFLAVYGLSGSRTCFKKLVTCLPGK